ncbi:MAG: hypothetical protein IT377_34455 [Polyangiaceae bacterium]|nr:hypothetical protein [Polyangiaceae bacterium]
MAARMKEAALIAAAAGVFACSLINEFSDVVPEKDASAGGAAGSGASGGTAGTAGSGGGGAGGTGGTTGGAGGSDGGDAGPAEPGLIVTAGKATPDGGTGFTVSVLSALSPQTGAELQREVGKEYTAILYESGRALWFLLEQVKNDAGTPSSQRLCARSFDRKTNKWATVGKCLDGLPLSAPGSAAAVVLRQRVAYLAYPSNDLILVSTTDPNAMTTATEKLTAPGELMDIVGHVKSGVSVGGNISVIRKTCVGNVCDLKIEVLAVAPQGLSVVQTPVIKGTFTSTASPGWTASTDPSAPSLILALSPPPVDGGGCGTPCNAKAEAFGVPLLTSTASAEFSVPGLQRIAPPAFDPCLNTMVTGLTTDQTVHIIPFGSGASLSTVQSTQLVQRLLFEPYTRSVLSPFAQSSNAFIQAWKLSGTAAAPKLTPRGADWKPPPDLAAGPIAVAIPDSPECP